MPCYRLDPSTSRLAVQARSSVGPIAWEAAEIDGTVEFDVGEKGVDVDGELSAVIRVSIESLRSGNEVYDAELLRRMDARRYPIATAELRRAERIGDTSRYQVGGDITVHGATRRVSGTVEVSFPEPGRVDITGEQVLDIRDFGIPVPTILLLKIYPDVRVHLSIEAALEAGPGPARR